MNIQQMMKQAQQMQKKMQENLENLEKTEFEGISANGAVKVKLMGTNTVKSINIDSALIVADEKDILEDLLIVAINDALTKFKKASEDSTNNATGGFDPKKFKLPF